MVVSPVHITLVYPVISFFFCVKTQLSNPVPFLSSGPIIEVRIVKFFHNNII